jgi:hypothetical protein
MIDANEAILTMVSITFVALMRAMIDDAVATAKATTTRATTARTGGEGCLLDVGR